MKKMLSVVLALLMLASTFVFSAGAAYDADDKWIPDNANWDAISRDGVVARFAIGADPHFTLYNSESKNPNAYKAFEQIGGVDAFLVAGDLTHDARNDQYEALMECVNTYTMKNDINPNAVGDSVGATILSMGNHEFENESSVDYEARFTEYTGQQPDALHWINGIPIISISPDQHIPERSADSDTGNCYDLSEKFLRDAYAEIDSKGYDGLIIMIAHHRTSTDGVENKFWPQKMLDMMKAHPNTMVFTGHSHTWIEDTGEFIIQDAGFTHVRAGSLGNNYGGVGSGSINPNTGKPQTPLGVEGDSNCSCTLVDIMKDGTAKIRRLDLAKGEYWFPDEDFIVRPNVLTDYIHTQENENFALSYGNGSQKPSFPSDMKIAVEDQGNNSSIIVKFPEAVPATKLAKDFVAEYRIRLKTPALDENGNPTFDEDGKPVYNYLKSSGKNYFRVGNYRAKADEGKDWSVLIHGLAWDTDYTVEICAVNAYGKTSEWVMMDGAVNIGTGNPTYPAVPVIDFDYSYGKTKDGAGHKLVSSPAITEEAEVDGQKAVNIIGIGGDCYAYRFTEEDFNSIKNYFVLECYFSASDITSTQCVIGGWDAANLGFKIENGKLNLWANIMSMAAGQVDERNIVGAPIESNVWTHAIAVFDGNSMKLYINGELVDENENAKGGLDIVSYTEEQDENNAGADQKNVIRNFCVGAGEMSDDGVMYPMNNCLINKAALYSGVMTDEDVKTAYKIATTALPFTDVNDSWYIDSVEYAYVTKLMNGTEDTIFDPNGYTTRAMIVQMLYNLEGRPAAEYKNTFTDIKNGKWYTKPIMWAYQNGVTKGTSDTTFSPDEKVSRQEVAVFLYRYLKDYKKAEVGEGADLSSYVDAGSISSWAEEAMPWANANGIVGGKYNGGVTTLSPKDTAMRSEVAKMFVSFAKKFS